MQAIPAAIDSEKTIMTESILVNNYQFSWKSTQNFVDLAGSEKITIYDTMKKSRDYSANHYSSGSQQNTSLNTIIKERVNESKHINKSLFFLTQVISLRSQGKP